MAWEYLQTKELDKRFEYVAGCVDVKDKDILDLDAGSCRFINYIPDTFSSYYANDVLGEYDPKHPRIDFRACTDVAMYDYMEGKNIDILCVFGWGAGHIVKNGFESETLVHVFPKFLKRHKPEVIVIESSTKHNENTGLIDEALGLCVGYAVTDEFIAKGNGDNDYTERIVYVLRR